jgi:hypothetical protein
MCPMNEITSSYLSLGFCFDFFAVRFDDFIGPLHQIFRALPAWLRLNPQFKILNPIVTTLAVGVVNVLVGPKWPAEMLFHHQAMSADLPLHTVFVNGREVVAVVKSAGTFGRRPAPVFGFRVTVLPEQIVVMTAITARDALILTAIDQARSMQRNHWFAVANWLF